MSFSDLMGVADKNVREVLGQTVIYSPGSGDPVEVAGIFDAAYVKIQAGQAGISSCGPALFLTLDDLPSDPSDDLDDARVTVAGVVYRIDEAKPDGLGTVLLLLHRA